MSWKFAFSQPAPPNRGFVRPLLCRGSTRPRQAPPSYSEFGVKWSQLDERACDSVTRKGAGKPAFLDSGAVRSCPVTNRRTVVCK